MLLRCYGNREQWRIEHLCFGAPCQQKIFIRLFERKPKRALCKSNEINMKEPPAPPGEKTPEDLRGFSGFKRR